MEFNPATCGLSCLTADPGQGQQFIHQTAHLLGSFLNPLQITRAFGIESRTELFQQNSGEAGDMTQRSAQIMGHAVGERLQFLVGFFQLGGALGDPVLEFRIQGVDFALGVSLLGDIAECDHAAAHSAMLIFQGTAHWPRSMCPRPVPDCA